jgi:APA family basic amino acid/polyamine antiporter
MTECDEPAPNHRERRLGLGSAASLVVANMIGSGVFTTSGFALADLGRPEPVLLAWLVGGALAMCGALSYGALARRIPESGGEYTYLARTIHPLAGFLAGWVSLLAGFTAPIAVAALALQAYLADSFGSTHRPEWVATIAILAATLMHGLRLREGVALQNVAVALKVLAITAFIAVGLRAVPLAALTPSAASIAVEPAAFAVTLVWISFAYSGWNAAVYVAGEVRDPDRNLPRALCLGTGVVTALYLGLNAVFLYAAPAAELAGRAEIGAVAAQALGGLPLRRLLSALVALALFTALSSMLMAGPRVYARMAEDGVFPRLFARGADVPTLAILLQAVLAVVVVWVSGLSALLGYIGFTLGLSAAATVGGLVALRRREGRERVPIPGYPVVPLVFIAVTIASSLFMAVREPLQATLGLLTAATGIPLYFWATSRASRGPSPASTPSA